MHRLTYTHSQYEALIEALETSKEESRKLVYEYPKTLGKHKHSDIPNILRILYNWKRIIDLFNTQRINEWIYQKMGETLTQHELQVLYHEPFNNMPLLISHWNLIVVVFAVFRLKIGK